MTPPSSTLAAAITWTGPTPAGKAGGRPLPASAAFWPTCRCQDGLVVGGGFREGGEDDALTGAEGAHVDLVPVLFRHGPQVVVLEGLGVEVDVHLGVAQGGEVLADVGLGDVGPGDQEADHERGVEDLAEAEGLRDVQRDSEQGGRRHLPVQQRIEPLVGRSLCGKIFSVTASSQRPWINGRDAAGPRASGHSPDLAQGQPPDAAVVRAGAASR